MEKINRIWFKLLRLYKYIISESAQFECKELPMILAEEVLSNPNGVLQMQNEYGLVVGVFYSTAILDLLEGYRWDGPSGPTYDSPVGQAGSAIHDFFYAAERKEYIGWTPKTKKMWKKYADIEFKRQLKISGMNWFRRTYYYIGVKNWGRKYTRAEDNKQYEVEYGAP